MFRTTITRGKRSVKSPRVVLTCVYYIKKQLIFVLMLITNKNYIYTPPPLKILFKILHFLKTISSLNFITILPDYKYGGHYEVQLYSVYYSELSEYPEVLWCMYFLVRHLL